MSCSLEIQSEIPWVVDKVLVICSSIVVLLSSFVVALSYEIKGNSNITITKVRQFVLYYMVNNLHSCVML